MSEAAGKSKIITHVGSIGTGIAQEYACHARSLGVDAISSVTPFYFKFSFEELKRYYFQLAHSVDLPFVVYNFPALAGFELTPEHIGQLSQRANIQGVKFTSKDLYAMERIKQHNPEITIFNGHDEVMLYGLMAGANGGIGSSYNFMPQKYVRLQQLFQQGDFQSAALLQTEINAIIEAMIPYGVNQSVKHLLSLQGIDSACSPFSPISEERKEVLNALQHTITR